jgi:DNA-directed RNA polymerase specialized sigma24 family protein
MAIPLSLDASQSQAMEGEGQDTWLDLLADPRSLPREAPPRDDHQRRVERWWLRQQLQGLDPLLRELVLDRVLLDCTWVELGQRLGLHPRMAERRCNAVLRDLRTRADAWRHGSANPMPEEAAG